MVTIKRPIHRSKRKQSMLPISAWFIIVGLVYFFFFEYGPSDPLGPEKDSPGYWSTTTTMTEQQQQQHSLHHAGGGGGGATMDGDGTTGDTTTTTTGGGGGGIDHTTASGYYLDFAYERSNPSYHQLPIPDWSESEDHVHMHLPNQGRSFRSCQYLSDDHRKVLIHSAHCKLLSKTTSSNQQQQQLIAYNTLSVPRTWCGQIIGPQSAVVLENPSCKNDNDEQPTVVVARVLPKDEIPIDGTDMPPIIIQSHDGRAQNVQDVTNCNIPCQEEVSIAAAASSSGPLLHVQQYHIQGQPSWKILVTDQDPQRNKVGGITIARTAFRKDIYYSTTSFQSSVPRTFFDFDTYPLLFDQDHAVQWDQVQDSASYLQSTECNTQPTKKGRWSGAIMDAYRVASYGNCNHNTDVPGGKSLLNKQDRMELRRKHKFDIAIDFGTQKDHISSTIWESLESGTVPIILGANNIGDHLPKNSFVDIGRFSKFEQLGDYIANTLSKNRTLWESYHAWRTDPTVRETFQRKYEFSKTSATCRLCRWAYAKQYGLGWDHVKQQVQETVLPQSLCLDNTAEGGGGPLVTQPFRETWISGGEGNTVLATAGKETTNCKTPPLSSATTTIIDNVFTRTVFAHDNVVDIHIQLNPGKSATTPSHYDLTMKMEFPIHNRGGAYFPDAHLTVDGMIRGSLVTSIALQDRKSKITILTSWNTQLVTTTGTEGVVLLKVHSGEDDAWHDQDETRRVRIIVEDLNPLHDKMTEYYPSSFGKLLIQDFVDPLELFYVESS